VLQITTSDSQLFSASFSYTLHLIARARLVYLIVKNQVIFLKLNS